MVAAYVCPFYKHLLSLAEGSVFGFAEHGRINVLKNNPRM
jgi:hypothetical protein